MEQLFATYGIPFIIIYVVITGFGIRMVSTVIHEAGHAVAIVLMTGKRAVVYLGSYGDHQKSVGVKLGPFDVWVRKNPFRWKGGLCVSTAPDITTRQKVIYTVAGPAATLTLFFTALLLFIYYPRNGLWAPFLLILCIVNGLGFLYNMVPAYAAIITGAGSVTYNDGAQLYAIWNRKHMPAGYENAVALVNEGKIKEGAAEAETIIRSGTKKPEVYRLAVEANIMLKDYAKADALQKEQIAKIGNINTHDRINLGVLKTMLGKYEEAIGYYKHLLQTGEGNKYNLNNFGYTLTMVQRYEEAIPYLDKAIAADSTWGHPWNNRGYARFRLGFIEDGRADMERSLELDPNNAFVYRNLGIWHYDRGNYRDALAHLERARELDPDIPWLGKYYLDVNQRLGAD